MENAEENRSFGEWCSGSFIEGLMEFNCVRERSSVEADQLLLSSIDCGSDIYADYGLVEPAYLTPGNLLNLDTAFQQNEQSSIGTIAVGLSETADKTSAKKPDLLDASTAEGRVVAQADLSSEPVIVNATEELMTSKFFGVVNNGAKSKVTKDKQQQQKKNAILESEPARALKRFVCEEVGCERKFNFRRDLNDHTRKCHTGERPFLCFECGKRFLTSSVFYEHRMIHNGDRRHHCVECGRSFHRAATLKNHKRIHTGEKPYTCAVCNKKFRQRGPFIKHSQTQHSIIFEKKSWNMQLQAAVAPIANV